MAIPVNITINAKDNATAVIGRMNQSVSSGLSSLNVMAGKLAAQGISMAMGEIRSFASAAIDMGGKLTDASLKTGISASQLQVFWDAAKMAGIEADAFDGMIVKMNKSLGSGAAADSLKKLGLSAEQLNGKSAAEQFKAIGMALADVPDQAQKTAIAMDIFGRSGTDVLSMLGGSSQAFAENLKDSSDNVRPMSDSVVAYLDQMGDAMDRAKQNAVALAGEGIAYAASAAQAALAPALEFVKQKMADISAWNQENAGGWQMLAEVGLWMGNTIFSAFQVIYAAGKMVFGGIVDIGRISLGNLVEMGFWMYDNFVTVFSNIPQLAVVAFKTVASIVGGVLKDIITGNLTNIGSTISASMASAGTEMKKLGVSALELENPMAAVGDRVGQFGKDMMDVNTNAFGDMLDLARKGAAQVDATKTKKNLPTPMSDMVEKEKKAKDQLANLYTSGSSDIYKLVSRASPFAAAPDAMTGTATTPFLQQPAAAYAAAGNTGNPVAAKLDQMILQLQGINGTLSKMQVA